MEQDDLQCVILNLLFKPLLIRLNQYKIKYGFINFGTCCGRFRSDSGSWTPSLQVFPFCVFFLHDSCICFSDVHFFLHHVLYYSGAEIKRFVAMLKNGSPVLRASAAFAILQASFQFLPSFCRCKIIQF